MSYSERINKLFSKKSRYDGFKFVLQKHKPVHGSEHLDLRFEDLYHPDQLQDFAIPIDWLNNFDAKTTCYKMPMHNNDWIGKEYQNKRNQLEIVDEGTVDYKCYRPSGYFELLFHGKYLSGLKRIMKIKCNYRNDVWLINNRYWR